MELKGENISKRFLDITIEILKLIKKLPTDYSGLHIGKQLLRSSTSSAANYEEARAAQSNADFIHKLKLSLKEIRESNYWLKIIDRSDILKNSSTSNIITEFTELSNIIAKSIITVQNKSKK
jgi:four helix bundle protein